MFKDVKCHAIVLAAGKGNRFGSDIPKQFMALGKKPVAAHSLQVFEKMECIDSVVLVTLEEYINYCKKIVYDYGCNKICAIVPGGKSRQESVYNGIKALSGNEHDIIIIHDSARPFIKASDVLNTVEAAYVHKAAVLALPATDTVKLADDKMFTAQTLYREKLYLAQTPQAFRKDILVKAHENEKESSLSAYDDCQLVEKTGIRPKIIIASNKNIKITHSFDLEFAEFLMEKGSDNLV